MKGERVKKLHLDKLTIQNLSAVLDRDEQKRIKGGSENCQQGTTQVPIYC